MRRQSNAALKEAQEECVDITFIIEPDADQFHAYAHLLPGLHIDGRTVEEAFSRAKRAAAAYLESLARHGDHLAHVQVQSAIPKGAVVKTVTLEWPSHLTSGSK
jgi:predicted RNase H-like HicB family nuclease